MLPEDGVKVIITNCDAKIKVYKAKARKALLAAAIFAVILGATGVYLFYLRTPSQPKVITEVQKIDEQKIIDAIMDTLRPLLQTKPVQQKPVVSKGGTITFPQRVALFDLKITSPLFSFQGTTGGENPSSDSVQIKSLQEQLSSIQQQLTDALDVKTVPPQGVSKPDTQKTAKKKSNNYAAVRNNNSGYIAASQEVVYEYESGYRPAND